jgi:hypothetical protein
MQQQTFAEVTFEHDQSFPAAGRLRRGELQVRAVVVG